MSKDSGEFAAQFKNKFRRKFLNAAEFGVNVFYGKAPEDFVKLEYEYADGGEKQQQFEQLVDDIAEKYLEFMRNIKLRLALDTFESVRKLDDLFDEVLSFIPQSAKDAWPQDIVKANNDGFSVKSLEKTAKKDVLAIASTIYSELTPHRGGSWGV